MYCETFHIILHDKDENNTLEEYNYLQGHFFLTLGIKICPCCSDGLEESTRIYLVIIYFAL